MTVLRSAASVLVRRLAFWKNLASTPFLTRLLTRLLARAANISTGEKLELIVYGLRKDRDGQYICWAMEQLYRNVKKYGEANPMPRVLASEDR